MTYMSETVPPNEADRHTDEVGTETVVYEIAAGEVPIYRSCRKPCCSGEHRWSTETIRVGFWWNRRSVHYCTYTGPGWEVLEKCYAEKLAESTK